MSEGLAQLLHLLELETIEVNRFRGAAPGKPSFPQVYGGQVLGQALVAASRTVEGRLVHSFHAYFLRPGDARLPILYEVDRLRDGKSFTTRAVVALQNGETIFHLQASFQRDELGLEHQFEMPEVPAPESLPDERERRAALAGGLREDDWWSDDYGVEVRVIDPPHPVHPTTRSPHQNAWLRVPGELPNDPAFHRCVLAYASDWTLLDTSLYPHGISWREPGLHSASLDHAMWFHRPFRADDWLLYAQDSPSTSGARGFNRGALFSRDGDLVASVTQEGLVRLPLRGR